jgi:hypothetical protein
LFHIISWLTALMLVSKGLCFINLNWCGCETRSPTLRNKRGLWTCLRGKKFRIHLIKTVYVARIFCLIISDISTVPAVTTLQLRPNSHISFVWSSLTFTVANSTTSNLPNASRLILPQLIVICLRTTRLIQPHPHHPCFPSGASAMTGVASLILYVLHISYSLQPSSCASDVNGMKVIDWGLIWLSGTADWLCRSCGNRTEPHRKDHKVTQVE